MKQNGVVYKEQQYQRWCIKYNLLLFCVLFITRNVRIGKVRASQRWMKCTYTQGWRCGFYVKTLCLSVSLFLGQNISWHILFSGHSHNIYCHTSRLRVPRGHTTCLVCHPRNFRCTSPREYLRSVYFRKHVHKLLCHLRNLCGISAGTSSCLL